MEQQLNQEEDVFVLEPPAPVKIPTETQAQKPLAPLAPEQRAQVDSKITARVEDFVARLNAADLNSDEFRNMRDRAFSAGRAEITDTSRFIAASPFLRQATFKDYGDTPGAKAVLELSTLLAKANPKGRDLLGPVKVFGVTVPFGNKLRSYLDDFKPMGKRMDELMLVLEEEEDAQRKEIIGLDVVEGQLFEKLQKLDRATEFLTLLDKRIAEEATALAANNPEKSKSLNDEMLYYVRGNLSDVIAHKLLVVTGIGQARQLRHTGRMTLRGTQRVRTLGVDALAISQTMAIVAHNQKARMDVNLKAQEAVNAVVAGVGEAVAEHTKRVIEFESNPLLGIQTLEGSINKTLDAINNLNTFRSKAVETMASDNDKLNALYDKAKTGMRIEQKAEKAEYGDVFSI